MNLQNNFGYKNDSQKGLTDEVITALGSAHYVTEHCDKGIYYLLEPEYKNTFSLVCSWGKKVESQLNWFISTYKTTPAPQISPGSYSTVPAARCTGSVLGQLALRPAGRPRSHRWGQSLQT